jgi:hypothetical protein
MTSSLSADRKGPRSRTLPLAAFAAGLAAALLASSPNLATEVLDTPALGAVRLFPLSTPAEPTPPVEAGAALPEPAAGPADPATAPEVTVRAGSHPTFQRFVFDWPHDVAVVTERTGDEVVVRFAVPARFRPNVSVPEGQLEVQESRTVTLRAAGVTEVESFSLDDHRIVVDLYTSRPEARR